MNKQAYGERDIALAGAFVTLGHDGAVRIERGFVRAGDEPKKAKNAEAKPKAKDRDGLAPLSEKLVAELTAYRTSALRNELAKHSETAFLALVHALALDTFFKGSTCTCLEIAPKMASLSGHAPGIDESVAEQQTAERHAAWGKRLPEEPESLWTFIHDLPDSERMALLAHCVSLTANALQVRGGWPGALAHAGVLAREVALNMTVYAADSGGVFQPRQQGPHRAGRARRRVRAGGAEHRRHKETRDGRSRRSRAEKQGWLPVLLRATPQG